MILKAVVVFVLFYIAAFAAGVWSDVLLPAGEEKRPVIYRISAGGCISVLEGIVVSLVCGLFAFSAIVCVCAYAVLIAVTAVAGCIYRKRRGVGTEYTFDISPVLIVTVLAAAVQVFLVIMYRNDLTSALSTIASATGVFDSGSTSFADPAMILIGSFCRVLAVHPLVFIHCMLPAPIILFYNLCYLTLIDTAKGGMPGKIAAVLTVFALNIWGYQSDMLIPVTLLLEWFSTGVFIVHGLLTITAVILIHQNSRCDKTPKTLNTDDYIEDGSEEWDMNRHKIINARNLAIALGVLAVALILVVIVLNNKINKLYDATVNLQTDMNSRCSMYEFAPEGKIQGYLLKGSDGTMSFIGGGSKENAQALGDFLAKYGNVITNWYVYSDSESDSGAARQLISEGVVDAGSIFVINREEIDLK